MKDAIITVLFVGGLIGLIWMWCGLTADIINARSNPRTWGVDWDPEDRDAEQS